MEHWTCMFRQVLSFRRSDVGGVVYSLLLPPFKSTASCTFEVLSSHLYLSNGELFGHESLNVVRIPERL